MKKIKKMLAFLLAAAMMLAMSTTTFAVNGTGGTITITNAVSAESYTLYKVFDLAYANSDSNTVAYTFTATESNNVLLTALQNGYQAIGDSAKTETPFNVTESTVTGIYTVTAKDDATAVSVTHFLTKLYDNGLLDSCKVNATGDVQGDKSLQFSGLAYGYYYITSTSGSVVSIDSTNPDATVVDKNIIYFDKEEDDESVEVGQTVHYTITAKVPDHSAFSSYTYKVTDTMSEGLTFNKDVKITVGTDDNAKPLEAAKYVCSYNNSGDGFALDITGIKELEIGATITITYSATVNENAVAQVSTNEAKLKYSHDPEDSDKTETITDEETVYTAKITIDKYEGGHETTKDGETVTDTSHKLSGASFVLLRYALVSTVDGTATYSFTDDNGGAITPNNPNAVKLYYKYTEATDSDSAKVSWIAETDAGVVPADATTMITDDKGEAVFSGLEDGTYYLMETEAPDGYNRLTELIPVTIQGENATVNNSSDLAITQPVENTAGSLLPSTGGMGTTVLYIVGAILVIGAGVLLIVKRRMNAE